jgi:hypothetical protein
MLGQLKLQVWLLALLLNLYAWLAIGALLKMAVRVFVAP